MALRQHNSKHLDRTFGAAVLSMLPALSDQTASAVERLGQDHSKDQLVNPASVANLDHMSWHQAGYLLYGFTGTTTAAADLPRIAVERSIIGVVDCENRNANLLTKQGAKEVGKPVSRESRLRRGYQRISSHPVA